MIEICNLRKEKLVFEYDFSVDRTTLVGNPFIMKTTSKSERDAVCNKYQSYFYMQISTNNNFLNYVNYLIDTYKRYEKLRLFCWCSPERCHAETIRDFIYSEIYKKQEDKTMKMRKIAIGVQVKISDLFKEFENWTPDIYYVDTEKPEVKSLIFTTETGKVYIQCIERGKTVLIGNGLFDGDVVRVEDVMKIVNRFNNFNTTQCVFCKTNITKIMHHTLVDEHGSKIKVCDGCYQDVTMIKLLEKGRPVEYVLHPNGTKFFNTKLWDELKIDWKTVKTVI